MIKYLVITAFLGIVFAGCTSASRTTSVSHVPSTMDSSVSSASSSELTEVNDKLCYLAGLCHSLYAEGTITLKDGSSSQSGHFELRSKRDNQGRDSLSMVITGPFGISAAKFLGTPEEFHFYNAIENEKYHGVPDEKTLEKLTGMKGFSFTLLHDLVYGISPTRFSSKELPEVKHEQLSTDRSRLLYNSPNGYIEAINYRASNQSFKITGYDRWNVPVKQRTDLSVKFSGVFEESPFLLPTIITAESGSQSLELEYSKVLENPKNLTVKVKIPQ